VKPEPMESHDSSQRLSRRSVFKWFAVAAAAAQAGEFATPGLTAPAPAAKGYGTDPVVAGYYKPGDFWPLTLTAPQRETVKALADVILPADKFGPAASELRVPDYIDEWVSAPYDVQRKDRDLVIDGLKWLEDESRKRFKKKFAALDGKQQKAICDDICFAKEAKQPFRKAANFFQKFRSLAASAYYGTEEGWKAIGYEGNVPLQSFDGPPAEVLKLLGVEQTVK